MHTRLTWLFALLLSAVWAAAPAATETKIPQGLWQAFSEARHAIEPHGEDYLAHNHGNDQRITFGAEGIAVTPPTAPDQAPAWTWGLRLTGYGTPNAIEPIEQGERHAEGTRIQYRRGALTEWYENRPAGLEQGFTLHTPPAPDATELVLELAVAGGLTGHWEEPGQALRFTTPSGVYALTYRDLKVINADGKTVPAHLTYAADQLAIHVDAEGAAWPIVVDPVVVNEQKVTPAVTGDGDDGDYFGWSIALWDDTALVGARNDSDSGSAYVFRLEAGVWTLDGKLLPDEGSAGHDFGHAVALWGDTALIGDWSDDIRGTASGAAYVFSRVAGSWIQEQSFRLGSYGDRFGDAVALWGDTALIGAYSENAGSGAVYVISRSDGIWLPEAKLTASDSNDRDYFGYAVALREGTALIGAHGDDDAGDKSGAAYIFTRAGSAWSQQQKLQPSDASWQRRFGISVALSDDGALIGSDCDGRYDCDAAYVFHREGSSWMEHARLGPDSGASDDRFGYAVALDGDTAVIGDPRSGKAHVFAQNAGVWGEQAQLLSDAGEAHGGFGCSVSVYGDTALVGAYADDTNGNAAGAALAFARSGEDWSAPVKLHAGRGADGDRFGTSVALDGETALIGAWGDNDDVIASGAAYVFSKKGNEWRQEVKLSPTDAWGLDRFGYSVALSNDTALIGAHHARPRGAVYAFRSVDGQWSEEAKLVPDDVLGDDFGYSVAISDDTALIGAKRDRDNGHESGSAYVFVRVDNLWSQQAKLLADDGEPGDEFGWSVALDGETALVGSKDHAGLGAVYVFGNIGGVWQQQAKLLAEDRALSDQFGWSIALSDDTVLIGAVHDDDRGDKSGSAYVFARVGDLWSQQAKLLAEDGVAGDQFGWHVGLAGDAAIIGAIHVDDSGENSGGAYLFERMGSSWSQVGKVLANDGVAKDFFGHSVALSENTALVGAPSHDGQGQDAGAAYFYLLESDLPPTALLSVAPTGGEHGTVTSEPAGIDCGTTCEASFDEGTTVTLTATPEAGYGVEWGGACSGTEHTCVVSMDSDNTVTARFDTLQPPDDNLVAYFPFNGNALDASGNGHDGTVYGATLTEDRFGNAASAYAFDGVNDYIDASGVAAALQSSAAFSASFFVRPGNGNWGGLLELGNQSNGTWSLSYFFYNQTLGYGQNWNRSVPSESSSLVPVSLDEWAHIAIVYDDRLFKIYVNGEIEEQRVFDHNPIYDGDEWFKIGVNAGGGDEHFNGVIDDVRIYDRALSGEEVWALYGGVATIEAGISGCLQNASGGPLSGVTVDLYDGAGALVDSATTGVDGCYHFDITAQGLYRVEPVGADVYPQDSDGVAFREVEITDVAYGVGDVDFTADDSKPAVKLLFPRAGDKLKGEFGLFGTAFRQFCDPECAPIEQLGLMINGETRFYGTLIGGASNRLSLSQVVWRDVATNTPVDLSWETLLGGGAPTTLRVWARNADDEFGRSEAVPVLAANTAASAAIASSEPFPVAAPMADVTLASQVNGASPDSMVWYAFRKTEGLGYDARLSTADAIEQDYPKEDVYPVGLAVLDDQGNTLVDVLHATAYRPAYKGDPEASRAGSRLAAMGANVVSGNFYYQTTDMSLSGIGLPFELWRRYNSLSYKDESQEPNTLGIGGWGHSYDYAIWLGPSGRRLFLGLPDGHWERYAYVEDADGANRQWRPLVPGARFRIVENNVNGQHDGFLVYDRDQTLYRFNHVYLSPEHGGVFLPTRIEDRSGNALEISYDDANRIETIQDTLPNPRTIAFTYYPEVGDPEDGLLWKVEDGTGRSIEYLYNNSANLAAFRDRRGELWLYEYDDACAGKQLLTQITDPLGNHLITNTYSDAETGTGPISWDGECRVVTQTDGENNTWTISYPTAAETRVINPEGLTTTYQIDDSHMVEQVTDPSQGVASKAYVPDTSEIGHLSLPSLLTSPRTLETELSYAGSLQGNPTRITDPADRDLTLAWAEDDNWQDPGCTTTPSGGCTNRNLLTALRMPGTSEDYTLDYDAQGRVEQVADPLARTAGYAYNGRGQVTERTDPLGRVTQYGYDAQGLLTSVTDALDNDESYGYDAQGRIRTITNRRGYTTSIEYNENDQPTRIVDADLNDIVYTYDAAGNLTTVEDKRGFTTTYTYNGANLPATATRTDGQGNSYTVSYEYDQLLRLRRTTNARNFSTTRSYTPVQNEGERQTVTDHLGDYTVRQYDLDGNLVKVERRAADDSLLELIEYQRDELGRVRLETRRLPDNTLLSTHYGYNALGEVASIRDPKQITTYLEYDEIGRLVQTRRDAAVVDIAYDETSVAPNHRVIVTDPNDHDTVYTYDALDRLISRADPLGNTWRYEYDANGNLRYYRDAEDRATELVYDDLDRLTEVRYPDGSTVSYQHDASGNLTAITDALGTTSQSFDGLNRLLSRTDSFGQTLGYDYDGNSNITAIHYPGSRTVAYNYDPLDRATSVQDWLGNETLFTYDATGRLTDILHANGTEVGLTYDTAGRLTGYANRRSDGSAIASFDYTLDANGNPIAAEVTQPLVPPLANASHSFSYDAANRLLSTPQGAVEHDADGNLTVEHRGTTQIQYGYDDAHRLTSWSDGSDAIAYRYDGNGRRMASIENGAETRYLLDVNKGLPDVLARTDTSGQAQDYFVYGPAGLISRITPAGDSYVYHFDPTGSTLALSDASESLVNQYAYTPYGQVARQEGVDNPFEFIGRYGVMAEPNGLNFMRARFYHPEIGRFVSQDPIWGDVTDGQTLNLYGYALDHPISNVDPSGKVVVIGTLAAGAVALKYAAEAAMVGVMGYHLLKEPTEDLLDWAFKPSPGSLEPIAQPSVVSPSAPIEGTRAGFVSDVFTAPAAARSSGFEFEMDPDLDPGDPGRCPPGQDGDIFCAVNKIERIVRETKESIDRVFENADAILDELNVLK